MHTPSAALRIRRSRLAPPISMGADSYVALDRRERLDGALSEAVLHVSAEVDGFSIGGFSIDGFSIGGAIGGLHGPVEAVELPLATPTLAVSRVSSSSCFFLLACSLHLRCLIRALSVGVVAVSALSMLSLPNQSSQLTQPSSK